MHRDIRSATVFAINAPLYQGTVVQKFETCIENTTEFMKELREEEEEQK